MIKNNVKPLTYANRLEHKQEKTKNKFKLQLIIL